VVSEERNFSKKFHGIFPKRPPDVHWIVEGEKLLKKFQKPSSKRIPFPRWRNEEKNFRSIPPKRNANVQWFSEEKKSQKSFTEFFPNGIIMSIGE
jgi:hypothetical protein